MAADGRGHVPHAPGLAGTGADSLPGGRRRLWADRGGHGGAVFRSAGFPLPDLSPGPDFHPHDPRRSGYQFHGAAGAAGAGRGRRPAGPGGVWLYSPGGAIIILQN